MSDVLPFVIVGLATGSLYGLAGMGLVLTYRTSGVFNLAHGAVAAAAAFCFYSLRFEQGWPWPIALLVVVSLFGIVVGALLELLTRTLTGGSQVAVIVLTVGLILSAQGILFSIYGVSTRYFPPFLPESGFEWADVFITWSQVISGVIAVVAAGGLYVFLRATRLGISMRAVVDNPSLVTLTGERPARVTRSAWIIGSSFAALSGVLLAPTLGLDATLLTLLVVQSFGACAIGLFKSLPLTYIGGLTVGVAASLATKYITARPWSGLPSAMPFLVLIAVLLVVPARKLPRSRVGLGSLVAERRPAPRSVRIGVSVGAAAGLLTVPFVSGTYLPVWINALCYVVVFGSLALLLWTSGQISLCHLAFVAVGATTVSHLADRGLPWLVAVLAAGALTAPVGAVVAIPAIRMSGIYLALMTIGFSILMQNVVFQSGLMFGTRTTVEIGRPDWGPIDGSNDRWYYLIVLVAALVTMATIVLLRNGQLGRLLRAMAESPTMLATNGLSVNLTKVLVFSVSAFFAGIGGALIVTQSGSTSGQPFGPVQSLVLVAVLGICGQRIVRSPILAAALFTLAPAYVEGFDQNRQLIGFGIAALVAGLVLANRARLEAWAERSAADTEGRRRSDPIGARGDHDPRIERPAMVS